MVASYCQQIKLKENLWAADIIWNKEIRHKKVFFEFLDFARKYFGVKR